MDFIAKQIAPPKSWDMFEELCLALFQNIWQDQTVQKNGRQGQTQNGVDFFGYNNTQGGKLWGVQCKCKVIGGKLTKKDIDNELAKAAQFRPELEHWIIATTLMPDQVIQEYIRILNHLRKQQGKFSVSIFYWDKLQHLLHQNFVVAQRFYPEHFTPYLRGSTFHVPPTLTDYFADPVKNLERLHEQLINSKITAITQSCQIEPKLTSINGMGGVGKTQLALKYCQTYRNFYAGVWWFPAYSSTALEQECIQFCFRHKIILAPGEFSVTAMRDWLESQDPWLLVFDNAENHKDLRSYFPQTKKHHLIITSRIPDWGGIQSFFLDTWSPEQSLDFLQYRLPKANDSERLELARILGGLPLALEQSCAYIRKYKISIADYVRDIAIQKQKNNPLSLEDSQYCNASVAASLTIACESLSDEAQTLLSICSFLAPDPIPEIIFTENKNMLPKSLQRMMQYEGQWRRVVAELDGLAICQFQEFVLSDHVGNQAIKQRCLVFHRLTQAAIKIRLTNNALALTALTLIAATMPTEPHEPINWPRCKALVMHTFKLRDNYNSKWRRKKEISNLLALVATYLSAGPGLFSQVLEIDQQVLVMRRKALGASNPLTLTSMNNLAETHRQMGNFNEARDLHTEVLKKRKEVFGENHQSTLIAMSNLALTLQQQGELFKAQALQEEIVGIRIATLGEQHVSTLIALNNLAETTRMKGDLPGAQVLHEKTLGIRQRVLGDCHPNTITSRHNLAITHHDLGNSSLAIELMHQAFTQRVAVLGEDHPHTQKSRMWYESLLAGVRYPSNQGRGHS